MDRPGKQSPNPAHAGARQGRATPKVARARLLRRRSSDAEHLLWRHLRARRLKGFKFRRQVVLGPYIVDFFCREACLIIEADGGQHAQQQSYDARRTARLEAMGYKVMRFWNNDILGNLPNVLECIASALPVAPPAEED